MSKFRVDELTTNRVSGEAHGEPRDAARHRPKLVIKGVTYHQLRVERDGQEWTCEVYLDI